MTRYRSSRWLRGFFFSAVLLVVLILATAAVLSLNSIGVNAQGTEIVLDRGKKADGARWQALADYVIGLEDADCGITSHSRVQRAEAARLTGLAEHALERMVYRLPVYSRGRMADAMRLTEAASAWSGGFPVASPGLACLAES
jgi:hypothetical protein